MQLMALKYIETGGGVAVGLNLEDLSAMLIFGPNWISSDRIGFNRISTGRRYHLALSAAVSTRWKKPPSAGAVSGQTARIRLCESAFSADAASRRYK